MTTDPKDAAVEKLRIAIAEKLRWKRIGPENPCSLWPAPYCVTGDGCAIMMRPDDSRVGTSPPDYPNDPAAALLLVEHMESKGYSFVMNNEGGGRGKWMAFFDSPKHNALQYAETPAMAICRAFALANQLDIQ